MNKEELEAFCDVVREADARYFDIAGGNVELWVTDYFLPALERAGFKLSYEGKQSYD